MTTPDMRALAVAVLVAAGRPFDEAVRVVYPPPPTNTRHVAAYERDLVSRGWKPDAAHRVAIWR